MSTRPSLAWSAAEAARLLSDQPEGGTGASAGLDRRCVVFRLLGPLRRPQLNRRLDYLLSGSQGSGPERFVSHLPEMGGSSEGAAHDHADDEGHAHGGVGLEGASMVPS